MIVGGGRVVTPAGVVGGGVRIDGDRIVAVDDDAPPDVDATGGWIVPGFIDLQVNGGAGIDVTTEPHRIGELGGWLVRTGVTAFLPTVITCDAPTRDAALAAWPDVRPPPRGAVALGLHLEGPMLSPARHGAHSAALLTPPSRRLVEGWSRETGVALVTLAPELPGALEVIDDLRVRGVVVSVGHTDATAAEAATAFAAGARSVTHLYNAMRPFGHRDPGVVGAALTSGDVVVGLICDGVHVDPVAVAVAWRALGPDRLALISDAVAALGADDLGRTGARLGRVDVTVGPDGVRNGAGVLAGSTLRLDAAVRNLVAFTGCAVPDAVATVTSTPADLLGLADRGRLVAGARADVTVLDADLHVRAVVVGGQLAWTT